MALVVDGGKLVNKGSALGTGAACCCGAACCFDCLFGYGLIGFGVASDPQGVVDFYKSMGYVDARIDTGAQVPPPYGPEPDAFGLWLGGCCEFNHSNQQIFYIDPFGSYYVSECVDASYFRCADDLNQNECETTSYSPFGYPGVFKPGASCSSSPCDNPLP
jgi:hypothetical protein